MKFSGLVKGTVSILDIGERLPVGTEITVSFKPGRIETYFVAENVLLPTELERDIHNWFNSDGPVPMGGYPRGSLLHFSYNTGDRRTEGERRNDGTSEATEVSTERYIMGQDLADAVAEHRGRNLRRGPEREFTEADLVGAIDEIDSEIAAEIEIASEGVGC